MQHVQQNVGSNIPKIHNALYEVSLFIFKLDRGHSHITFCNILWDDPTQVRIYVVGAKIIAFFKLIVILLCWSSVVKIPVTHCLQFPHTVATMITTNNMFTLSCNWLLQNYFFPEIYKTSEQWSANISERTKVDGKCYCLEKRVYCKWKRFTKY